MELWLETQMDRGCMSHVRVVCFQVKFSATKRSLVQRNPTECGVSRRDFETLTMWRLGPNGAIASQKNLSYLL